MQEMKQARAVTQARAVGGEYTKGETVTLGSRGKFQGDSFEKQKRNFTL